jgi:hypothetical protein
MLAYRKEKTLLFVKTREKTNILAPSRLFVKIEEQREQSEAMTVFK